MVINHLPKFTIHVHQSWIFSNGACFITSVSSIVLVSRGKSVSLAVVAVAAGPFVSTMHSALSDQGSGSSTCWSLDFMVWSERLKLQLVFISWRRCFFRVANFDLPVDSNEGLKLPVLHQKFVLVLRNLCQHAQGCQFKKSIPGCCPHTDSEKVWYKALRVSAQWASPPSLNVQLIPDMFGL